MTPLDALTSESQLAAARVQLVKADTAVQQQEVLVKTFLSKRLDGSLGAATLEPLEALPGASDGNIPPISDSIARALERRSSIRQAQLVVQNQRIAEQYTRKNLLPVLSAYVAFDIYALAPGTSPALRQLIRWTYPEYSVGFTWSMPVLNRSAQADDVRARLETQQSEATLQRTRRQVVLQVQNATASIEQDRAGIRAADRALATSKIAYEGEQERLRAGMSTPYRVLQAQRDVTSAEAADVQARVNFAKALAAYDVAVSGMLEKHGIDVDAAERGSLWRP
jgi:outer membrane protein TolC